MIFGSDTSHYVSLITGSFSTYHQSVVDSTFDNVIVHTQKLKEDDNGVWIYTEQGEARNYKPYRRRVYIITARDNYLLQKTYTLKNPEQYVDSSIDLIDLEYKQGCDINIYRRSNTMYSGSTNGNSCVATFRGSTYVTSIFMVTSYGVVSLERGWDNNHNQVWGSRNGYYIYEKIQR